MGWTLLSTILRQPFAFLGAVGLVSTLKGQISLHEDVLVLINAYQAITQPVWEFLFGWLFDRFELPFPWWAKDYLTMGVIVSVARFRSRLVTISYSSRRWVATGINFFFYVIAWPIVLAYYAVLAIAIPNQLPELDQGLARSNVQFEIRDEDFEGPDMSATVERRRSRAAIFFEFLLWAAIIIATSYGLFVVKP